MKVEEQMIFKAVVKLSDKRYEKWKRWLDLTGHVPTKCEHWDALTYQFEDGIKFDVYLVSGEPRPYVDILFLDQNNSSIANCEPLLDLSEGRMLELDNNKYKIQFERNIK